MTEDKPVYGYIFRGVHVRLLHRLWCRVSGEFVVTVYL